MITTDRSEGPISFRTAEAGVEFLQNILAGAALAKPALTQCYVHERPWTFHQLYTTLDTSSLQEQCTRKDNSTVENHISVLLGSQSTFGNPPNNRFGTSKHRGQQSFQTKFWCRNGNNRAQIGAWFTKLRSMARNVNEIMLNNPHRAKHSLFELCH